jgi:hypothetical protein
MLRPGEPYANITWLAHFAACVRRAMRTWRSVNKDRTIWNSPSRQMRLIPVIHNLSGRLKQALYDVTWISTGRGPDASTLDSFGDVVLLFE